MSNKCDRGNGGKDLPSGCTSSSTNPLSSNGHKSTPPKIKIYDSCKLPIPRQGIRYPAHNPAIPKAEHGIRIRSNFENLPTDSCQPVDTGSRGKARGRLRGRRKLKKENNRSRSRKRRNVSQSRHSDSQEESGSSSSSSSDLRAGSRHENRNVVSRLVQYSFYTVVNTGVAMDQGATASALCRSFLALYLKLDESSVYSNILDTWDKAGQKIIVLKGYNHKHLQYLAKEVRHIAVESNTLYRTTGHARVMLVLTAFGREEDMEEAFDDLCYLH